MPKNENTVYEKSSLKERLAQNTTDIHAGGAQTELVTIEKMPLKERLAIPDSEDQNPKTILRHPLEERIEKAMNGESFENNDITPFTEMIRSSANVPLSDLVETEKLENIRKTEYPYLAGLDLGFPETYGDAARLIAGSWGEIASDGFAFDFDYLPDREFEIFLMLWGILLTEYNRRNGTDSKDLSYKDLSGTFTAASIPLPTYFKAAAAISDEAGGYSGIYLDTLYRNSFTPIITESPRMAKLVKKNLAKQPDKKTCYADPVRCSVCWPMPALRI